MLGVATWAITDDSLQSDGEKSYNNSSIRSRNALLSPWGGRPAPADNEFMRRLFRRWDAAHTKSLSLQHLVTGFADVKGTRDIMTNIAYFFDLYDDDGDGRVDRDGILKMSEALLFLGRRGVDHLTRPSPASPKSESAPDSTLTPEEQFLSSVSSFIRRCFEYADPDASAGIAVAAHPAQRHDANADFAIGDDEDLLDADASAPATPAAPTPGADPPLSLPPVPSEAKPNTHAANAALDPAHPLFISLPTFRMVILADEILESFFDAGFANTFRLADQPSTATSTPSPLSFTTFTNLGAAAAATAAAGGGPASRPGVVLPPGKGLRGMLDSIVTDGLRVAGEVRRRVEEAQRELDTAAAAGAKQQPGGDEDEEDEEEVGEKKGDAETRSIRSTDRDLLDTAEAEALDHSVVSRPASLLEREGGAEPGAASPGLGSGVIEFER
jgi:hypothetical protein